MCHTLQGPYHSSFQLSCIIKASRSEIPMRCDWPMTSPSRPRKIPLWHLPWPYCFALWSPWARVSMPILLSYLLDDSRFEAYCVLAILYIYIYTPSFFVIKPTRSTNFTNLYCHQTLHVLDSSSVHHQEFIHCILSNGICHKHIFYNKTNQIH